MTDEEKKAQGLFYEIDEKNKRIIYDPSENNYGKWDFNATASAKNMAEIAQRTGYKVEATFNDVTFSVTPGMSAEEATLSFAEAKEQHRINELKKNGKMSNDDMLIENETLDLDCPTFFATIKAKNLGDYTVRYAERWAKLMQAEMKTHKLSEDIVNDTMNRVEKELGQGSRAVYTNARDLLIETWKHGEELGHASNESPSRIAYLRSLGKTWEKKLCEQKTNASTQTDSKEATTTSKQIRHTVASKKDLEL